MRAKIKPNGYAFYVTFLMNNFRVDATGSTMRYELQWKVFFFFLAKYSSDVKGKEKKVRK